VSLYLLEGEDPDELIQYHRDDDGLGKHVERLAVAADTAPSIPGD